MPQKSNQLFLLALSLLVLLFTTCGLFEVEEEAVSSYETIQAIYLVNVSGGEPVEIARGYSPRFTPDNRSVLFISENRIYQYWFATSTTRAISDVQTGYLTSFTVTPEGNQLVFSAQGFASASFDILLLNLQGFTLKNVTNTPFLSEFFPDYAYTRPLILFRQDDDRIATVNPETGERHEILFSDSSSFDHPRFLPGDEQFIYYETPRKQLAGYLRLRHLSEVPTDTILPVNNSEYAIAPDGKSILSFDRGIFRCDLASLQTEKLANGYLAGWSPDGTRIVFVNAYGVYLMLADGSQQQRICDSESVAEIHLSPDNQRILFLKWYSRATN